MPRMARRGTSPVLYELLGSAGAPVGAPRASAPASESASGNQRQSVRVPIGWFWLSAVVALALMAVAYQFGRSSGERAGFSRGQELLSDRAALTRMAGDTPDPARRSEGAAGDRAPPSDSVRTPGGSATAPEVKPAPSTGDPRTKGRNYLVIARPAAGEADKLVSFLRSNGLEVAAVLDDNARFRKVVALPGFPAGTARSSEQVRSLENRVKSLGRTWKAAARGNRDFDDAYLELYR